MRKMVYKFLDEYLGDEVTCIKTGSTNRCYSYDIFSKKNKSIILSFKVYYHNERGIAIFRGDKLNDIVSNLFSMGNEESTSIIRDWFADKHDIVKVKDLMKFVRS
jgi:hypothetical protein